MPYLSQAESPQLCPCPGSPVLCPRITLGLSGLPGPPAGLRIGRARQPLPPRGTGTVPATKTLKHTAPAPEMIKRSHASRHPCGATAVMGLHSASLCPQTTFQALVPRLPHQLRRKGQVTALPKSNLRQVLLGAVRTRSSSHPSSSVPGGTRGAFKKPLSSCTRSRFNQNVWALRTRHGWRPGARASSPGCGEEGPSVLCL